MSFDNSQKSKKTGSVSLNMANSLLITPRSLEQVDLHEKKAKLPPFYRVLCFPKRVLEAPDWNKKGLVKQICFAVKASQGLKLLFPLCLADSASQSNQKLPLIVVAGFGEMAGIHECSRASLFSSFTLMATSAAFFFLFFLFPCFTLLYIKVIKFVLSFLHGPERQFPVLPPLCRGIT